MGIFSLPSRFPSTSTSSSTSTSTTTSMPRDDPSHKSRRRSSHSSKSSSAPSISSTGTTIHYPPPPPSSNMARDSTSRTSRPSRYTASYAEDSDSDSSSPTVGLFPPRTRDSGSYLPPPAPTPPLAGSAPGGYSYVPVPVYKSTSGHVYADDGSDGTHASKKSRRKAEKAAAAAAAEKPSAIPVPQVHALPSTATKLIDAPPARSVNTTTATTTTHISHSSSSSSATAARADSKLPKPKPAPAPAPKPGVLHRVRLRAKQSLERLPRMPVPTRPSITIRIPLPIITWPTLPRLPSLPPALSNYNLRSRLPARPTIPTKLLFTTISILTKLTTFFILPTLLILVLAATITPYSESFTLRYQATPPDSEAGLVTFTETYPQAHATLSCSIDISDVPVSVLDVIDARECVEGGWMAWTGQAVEATSQPSTSSSPTLDDSSIWARVRQDAIIKASQAQRKLEKTGTCIIKSLATGGYMSLPSKLITTSISYTAAGIKSSTAYARRISPSSERIATFTGKLDSWVDLHAPSLPSTPQQAQRLCAPPTPYTHTPTPPYPPHGTSPSKFLPQVTHGSFLLMSTSEKEGCWERCMAGCLSRGVKAGAVKVECKQRVGKVGRCWAGIAIEGRKGE